MNELAYLTRIQKLESIVNYKNKTRRISKQTGSSNSLWPPNNHAISQSKRLGIKGSYSLPSWAFSYPSGFMEGIRWILVLRTKSVTSGSVPKFLQRYSMRFNSSSLPTTSFPCIFPIYLNSGSPENKIITWKTFFPFSFLVDSIFYPVCADPKSKI